MRSVGFSTGALARSDFRRALCQLGDSPVDSVELSALRFSELEPLLESIPQLNLNRYRYISLHAPSRFEGNQEEQAIEMLDRCVPDNWPIIVHPDSMGSFASWQIFG